MFRKEPDFNQELESHHYLFNAIGQAFLFTNENVSGYVNNIKQDLNGARVLSVCASGDHAFTFYDAGAKQVDTFDINYAQKMVYELKNTMIHKLPYHEFMAFFYGKESFFNRKIIAPIWNDFSDALKIYLEVFYSTNLSSARRMFVYGRAIKNPGVTYTESRTEYNSLRHKLPKDINFLHSDLESLPQKLNAKYDLVVLSNIFDYMYLDAPTTQAALMKFYADILLPIVKNNLNPGGKITFEYLWGDRACNRSNFFDDWKKFQNTFNTMNKEAGLAMNTIEIPSKIENASPKVTAHILVLNTGTQKQH